ncbi:MAG: hypothetical protein OEL58_05590 [Desulfobacteraceae bacterium]|nr:hypothetical protein [Desulfobacteraceae bacterium]
MKKFVKVFMIPLILGFIGYFGYHQIMEWHQKELATAVRQEQNAFEDKSWTLKEEIQKLEEELAVQKKARVPEEKLTEVFGKDAAGFPLREDTDCEDLEQQIKAFFIYLDTQEYPIVQKSAKGSYDMFRKMVRQLSENPPKVTGETTDIVSLTRNMAHFYKILGKRRIQFGKDVLHNESDIIESMMATFFGFYTSDKCCQKDLRGCPGLGVLYQYAGFFLNTVGGRSYLLRRDSKVRILTTYYAILILDKANDAILNRYGIDIRPHINLSIDDIRNQKNLIYPEQYLTNLYQLQEKYKM